MRFRATLILCALGLDKLGELLKKWTAEPAAYSPQDMKDCLDSWREVLFKHLDEEASTLLAHHQRWQRLLLDVYKLCPPRPVIEQTRRSLAPPHCPLARPLEDLTRPRSSVSNRRVLPYPIVLITSCAQVEDLSGENMKKYWKLEEVDRIVI